ncbi:uncharacterized protein SAPINGB_P000958 [Magnusiomyces paraingens]|uniref:Uncharacterized protein n=1 Tax=Magnusiomyces paraingens TaxID=2606893 RepID=A0A5E8B510_9ASCO|nr:uncharacterized protein SAPINGB_P000958 [Saprochaete ingens]VVT45922.1 unnamed protein product [Saprochaete ingens]
MGAAASKQTINKTARKLAKSGAGASARVNVQTSHAASKIPPASSSTGIGAASGSGAASEEEGRAAESQSSFSHSSSFKLGTSQNEEVSEKPAEIIRDGLDPQHISRVQQLGSALDSGLIDRLIRETREQEAPKHTFSPHNELVSALRNRSAQAELAAEESSELKGVNAGGRSSKNGNSGSAASASASSTAAAAAAAAAATISSNNGRMKMYLHPQTLTAVVRALAAGGLEADAVVRDYGLDPLAVSKIGSRLTELPREDPKGVASVGRPDTSFPTSTETSEKQVPQYQYKPANSEVHSGSQQVSRGADFNAELGKLLGRAHGGGGEGHEEQDELEALRQARKPRRRQKSAFHVTIEQ